MGLRKEIESVAEYPELYIRPEKKKRRERQGGFRYNKDIMFPVGRKHS